MSNIAGRQHPTNVTQKDQLGSQQTSGLHVCSISTWWINVNLMLEINLRVYYGAFPCNKYVEKKHIDPDCLSQRSYSCNGGAVHQPSVSSYLQVHIRVLYMYKESDAVLHLRVRL